eukprot:gnl/Hemi2/27693_TR9158_c0_g1_i1.p1 gnl/Hemi2/27693_TR9158_c0_g1~~gnl/Hemi2/27693_TR9158_c0_g1_i1.p1  ORF type:complete len:230 (+),score=86.38 gnl/Hemi2/27693_TR9158_c0_g1_i1:58-690(+)
MDAASIATLLEKDRYNTEILPQLEGYVQAQVAQNTYDIDANLAVLKLYQFFPEKNNVAIRNLILVKALAALPAPDFSLCCYLIVDQDEESFVRLQHLASLLETCNYKQFWVEAKEQRALLDTVAGLDAALRKFICNTIGMTYQNITAAEVCSCLGQSVDTAPQVAQANGWTLQGGLFSVPITEDNQARPKRSKASINFNQLNSILTAILH